MQALSADNIRKIACVHQGYELYGSDRTFIACVAFLRKKYPDAAITVILAKAGPLQEAFAQQGMPTTVQDLWVLRQRYGVPGLLARSLRLPLSIYRAMQVLRRNDITYINTSVLIDYMLAARFFPSKAFLHVHEIPTGRLRWVFRKLVGFARCPVLFNSRATQTSFDIGPATPQAVAYNGVNVEPAMPQAPKTRDGINLLFIGRINGWKGQDLLVDALALLPPELQTRLRVRIVGDVFENAAFRDDLLRQIRNYGLCETVSVAGFVANPADSYAWSDIVVVPSRKPEPFGLVAIEAMAHGKPVIAARHGGLTEIVVENETGWFFRPNNAIDLARVIREAMDNAGRRACFGMRGHQRYRDCFTLAAFEQSFLKALADFTTIDNVNARPVSSNCPDNAPLARRCR